MKVFLKRAWRYTNRRISQRYLRHFALKTDVPMTRLGSVYGGWYAPNDMPKGALCYCAGVGVDATFDFGLVELGAEVHSFDPTPGSIEYMKENADKGVNFHPWGLWDNDKKMKFHFPLGEGHTSFFIHNLHDTDEFFEADCLRMSTIQSRLGHSVPYIFKLDIEGAWYEVILDCIKEGIYPHVIGLEFDSPAPVWRVSKITRALQKRGYRLAVQEKDNATFVRVAA